MNIRKKLASLALAATAFVVISTALPAQAATAEPVRDENVGQIQYGSGSFSLEGKAVAKAKVTSKSGAKIMLNVSVKPMPAKETDRCWTVPVGTKVDMEGIWYGVPSVKEDYVVQAGDNTFCTKEGHGNQVYKKSCGNRAWGVPGGPKKGPPRKMPRVKGKVTFADYYTYTVGQTAKETVTGSAAASVAVYDSAGRTLCQASGTISGKGFALSATTVRVRSRSAIQAEIDGGRQILINAQADTDLHIRAKNVAKVELDGQVDAYCAAYPPEETTTYQAPSASAQAKACVKPGQQTGVITASGVNPNDVAAPGTLTIGGQTKQFPSVGAGQTVTWDFSGFAPGNYQGTFTLGSPINKSVTFPVTVAECVYQNGSIIEVVDVNDVRYGSTYFWRIRGMVPDGQSAVLRVSSIRGTVKESDKSIQLGSGAFDLTIQYTAPSEGSSDTLTAKLFGPDGVLDDEKSDTFDLLPNPVDPL